MSTADSTATSRSEPERYALNAENTRWRVVDGEAVLISLTTTHYYSLNDTGTFVWELLAGGAHTAEDLADAVAARYRRPVDGVLDDVRLLLDELVREDLVLAR